ncbi:hypothetical protein LTR27_011924 [Elasticomyces elasticus]|nr:hypothetical protein LTR27_011924 [Elasticomyces elasticus]
MFSSALAAVCFLVTIFSLCNASRDSYHRSSDYNSGHYGTHVTQTFRSTTIKALQLNLMLPFSACDDDGSKLFLAPRGTRILSDSAPMIFDANGDFIWTPERKYGQVYNFQVQQYKGEPHLIFWAGNDAIDGHGAGHYYMLNKHYEQVARISATNHLTADLHSFSSTSNNTAILSIYQTVVTDVPAGHGTSKGYIWDCLFQELDIETGKALFEWRASEHFAVTDSYIRSNGAMRTKPWDFFHINMIEKDEQGNYLISSRHLRAIIYVDGRTGDVLWQLGGKHSSFTNLSGGEATSFVGQHDAHWADASHSAITLFDNGADWQDMTAPRSRGMRIAVDLRNMTTRLEAVYTNPNEILSISQGSYQTLANGNVLLGYGFNGVMTEFDKNGTVLCDAWFMPQTRFGSGDVQSYRDMKYPWTGLPRTSPSLVFDGVEEALSMSWNGATEVKRWMLYAAHQDDGEFTTWMSFPKQGFETQFVVDLDRDVKRYVRAVALDVEGRRLGMSLTVDMGNRTSVYEEVAADGVVGGYEEVTAEVKDSRLLVGFGIAAFGSGVLVAWLWFATGGVGQMQARRR